MMMNEQFIIYLWSILENLVSLLVVIGVAFAIVIPLAIFLYTEERGQKPRTVNIITSIIIGSLLLICTNFIPSKQDLALIIAYPYLKNGVMKLEKSDTTTKLLQVSNKYLDSLIKASESR
jgi:hypothetical protein